MDSNLGALDRFKVNRPSRKSARRLAKATREVGAKYTPGLHVSRVLQLRWLYRLDVRWLGCPLPANSVPTSRCVCKPTCSTQNSGNLSLVPHRLRKLQCVCDRKRSVVWLQTLPPNLQVIVAIQPDGAETRMEYVSKYFTGLWYRSNRLFSVPVRLSQSNAARSSSGLRKVKLQSPQGFQLIAFSFSPVFRTNPRMHALFELPWCGSGSLLPSGRFTGLAI